jgi:hypothetical protein
MRLVACCQGACWTSVFILFLWSLIWRLELGLGGWACGGYWRRDIVVGIMEEGEVRRKSLVRQVVVGQQHLHVLGMQRQGCGEAGSWVGGEVQLKLGLESGVVVDGFDKSGEDVIGRGGVLEKSKFGNVDLVVSRWVGKSDGCTSRALSSALSLKRSDVEGVPCSAATRCMTIGIVAVVIPNTGSAMRARFAGPIDSSRMAVNSATAVWWASNRFSCRS